MTALEVRSWTEVQVLLEARPKGAVLRIPKGVLPHPRTHGMLPTFSVPTGQQGEWIGPYRGGGGLHVQDRGSYYHCEVVMPPHAQEGFDPGRSAAVVGGCAAAGAAIGAATGRTNGAVLAGALLGALLGAAVIAAAEGDE